MTALYVSLWEFIVEPAQAEEFQRLYGPSGSWVALFRRAAGYIDTLLLRDRADPHRFLTIDRWNSADAHRAFRAAFSREYAELDARCEDLTVRESALGEFSAPVTANRPEEMSPTPRYTGGCLCGGVGYALSAEPGPIEVCYCQMCRKASGGPLATNAPVAAAAFHVSAGLELLEGYESCPGERRFFCRRCGSPIYSQQAARPEVLRVRVGTINEPLNVRPTASYYTGSRCNWWEIHDALPRFETE